jgi:hypothetical protein
MIDYFQKKKKKKESYEEKTTKGTGKESLVQSSQSESIEMSALKDDDVMQFVKTVRPEVRDLLQTDANFHDDNVLR